MKEKTKKILKLILRFIDELLHLFLASKND